MANIGSTLRDTRIRNKIDITSVEAATKIRAKYLRALENEEWSVLPGPTYVKSFLRTYAEYLGLDPHLLLEEYNARYEEPEELELPAFRSEAPIRDQVTRFGPPSRGAIVGIVLVAFVAFLFILGITNSNDGGNGDGEGAEPATQTDTGDRDNLDSAAERRRDRRREQAERDAQSGVVRVSVEPKREVWVCLVDAQDRARVNGQVVQGGDRQGPYRSKSFRITVGNGGGDFEVNGKTRNVPETSEPISYSISAKQVRTIEDGPTCA